MPNPDEGKSDIPDIPLAVQQRKGHAVTPEAAALTDLPLAGSDDQGRRSRRSSAVKRFTFPKVKGLDYTAPRAGMTRQQIETICGKTYKGAPVMDPALGDQDPKFATWLWKNHPRDAAVRYFCRNPLA